MEVLILGGAGMVGQKLLKKIIEKRNINGKAVSKIKLFDIVDADYPENTGIEIEIQTNLKCQGVLLDKILSPK